MPVLKFQCNNDDIALDKLHMEDITKDKRSTFIDFKGMTLSRYQIQDNIYMVKNQMFFDMAKVLNTSRKIIDAMLVQKDGKQLVIVPEKNAYVFWNGKNLEPEKYTILQTEENQKLQNQLLN